MSKSRFVFDKFAKLIAQGLLSYKDLSEEIVNIDSVFQNIKSIYSKKLLKIIYNILLILDEDAVGEIVKKQYLNGLISILAPTNDIIRKWIREKLTC